MSIKSNIMLEKREMNQFYAEHKIEKEKKEEKIWHLIKEERNGSIEHNRDIKAICGQKNEGFGSKHRFAHAGSKTGSPSLGFITAEERVTCLECLSLMYNDLEQSA